MNDSSSLPDGREATALTVIHSSKEPSTSVQQNMHSKVQNALQVRSREIFLVKPEIKSTEFVKISIRIEKTHNLADNYNCDISNKDTDMCSQYACRFSKKHSIIDHTRCLKKISYYRAGPHVATWGPARSFDRVSNEQKRDIEKASLKS